MSTEHTVGHVGWSPGYQSTPPASPVRFTTHPPSSISDPLPSALAEMEAEARWLEVAAKKAAKDGMYDTGAGFRNRAGGVRRAMEILEKLQILKTQA